YRVSHLRGQWRLRASEHLRDRRGDLELLADVEHLDIDVDRAAPVELPRARCQHTCDLAVLAHKTHLPVSELHDGEVTRDDFARVLHQEIDPRMHELGHT